MSVTDSDFAARLLARAHACGLSIADGPLLRLQSYAELLRRWNQKINLTALPLDGWPDATLDRLFLEPLLAAPLAKGITGRWVDLGSGGGSPAIPMAIVVDGPLELTLSESRERKAAFLREALRAVELADTTVVGRFETLLAWPAGSVQLMTCRAINPEETAIVADYLLAPDGQMLYFGTGIADGLDRLRLNHAMRLEPLDATVSVLTRF